uniref:Uncharacterized protein n=1 Tax=Rhizophora mucronata TaxID=61149 RepID=A0A2P2P644_RHIMU
MWLYGVGCSLNLLVARDYKTKLTTNIQRCIQFLRCLTSWFGYKQIVQDIIN